MEAKQCIFVDEEKTIHPGIYCTEDNGNSYIICLCCGGIVDPKETICKVFESWMSFGELSEIAESKDEELTSLRKAESCIREYLAKCGDIEICFDEGVQDIRNFQGFEINPLSL